MAGVEEGTKCNQSAAKVPEIKGLESSRQNHMLFNTRTQLPQQNLQLLPKLLSEWKAAGSRSGLHWTATLRETSLRVSPSATSTQPCPNAQLHISYALSETMKFCLSHRCTEKCGQQDCGRIAPQTPALLLSSQTQHKLLLSKPLIDKSATEASNT